MKKFRILSLDGGGARGLFTSKVLRQIKEEYGIEFYKYFDLIIGTSTGSIIAAALATGIDIEVIERLYTEEMDKIFKKDILKNGIIQSRYDNTHLRNVLTDTLDGKEFEDVNTRLMITATNIVNGETVILEDKDHKGIGLVDAVLSSCAAPIFFDPLKIDKERILADGGLWANNPSLAAISEILCRDDCNVELKDIKLLSVGTGEEKMMNEYGDMKLGWGIAGWAAPLMKIIFQLGSKSVHDMVLKLLPSENYMRIDYEADKLLEIDVADKDTHEKAAKAMVENRDRLREFFRDKDAMEDMKQGNEKSIEKNRKKGLLQRIFGKNRN